MAKSIILATALLNGALSSDEFMKVVSDAECFCKVPANSALIVIDMQNDFLAETGTLKVPKGRDFIPKINRLANLSGWAAIGYSLDYHPHDHISFASSHGKAAMSTIDLSYDTKYGARVCFDEYAKYGASNYNCSDSEMTNFTQVMWPDHCVQNTWGYELDKELEVPKSAFLFRKGYTTVVDSYSAFNNVLGDESTNLRQILDGAGVKNVYVTGVAQDYCVHYTSRDAQSRGYTASIFEDVTAPVDPADKEKAGKLNTDGGAKLLQSGAADCKCEKKDDHNDDDDGSIRVGSSALMLAMLLFAVSSQ